MNGSKRCYITDSSLALGGTIFSNVTYNPWSQRTKKLQLRNDMKTRRMQRSWLTVRGVSFSVCLLKTFIGNVFFTRHISIKNIEHATVR